MVSILVVSKDADFSQVIAELAKRELGVDCALAADAAEARTWPDASLAVSDAPCKLPMPLLTVDKPVRMRELLADLRARLAGAQAVEWLRIGEWQCAPRLKSLRHGEKQVSLTDKEIQLLQYLLEAGGSVGKDELLKKVWGFEPDVDTHTLETHIYRLRSKCRELSDASLIVATESGYALQP